jgi:hypothetical protein
MTQTFRLKKGEISIGQDKIVITDKAKMQRYMSLFSTGIWIVLGIQNVLKFKQSSDELFHSFWSVLGIVNLIIFIATLSRSTLSVIPIDEVKSIKLRQRFNNTMLDIKLKNNRLRRVLQVEDAKELDEYIKTNFYSIMKL